MKARILIGTVIGLIWLQLAELSAPAQVPVPTTGSTAASPLVDFHIGKATLHAEIAATNEERERGLMFRRSMGDNNGMLFLMPGIAPATFWMKNTLIPLSVAFIDKDGVILEIHDMQPLDETITRSDSHEVAYALEANQHWFSLNGIKPGDRIDPAPGTLNKIAAP